MKVAGRKFGFGNYSLEPATVYCAEITTRGGEVHSFQYLCEPGNETPVILRNEVEFRMPDYPTFVKTEAVHARFDDRTVPGYELRPVFDSDVPEGVEPVDVPAAFTGAIIPVVGPSDAPTYTIEYPDGTEPGLWQRLGAKSKELL